MPTGLSIVNKKTTRNIFLLDIYSEISQDLSASWFAKHLFDILVRPKSLALELGEFVF